MTINDHRKCYWFNRWFTLFAGLTICGAAGTTYAFGVYAPKMKEVLGYTQSQMNLIGIFPYFGSIAAVLLGLLLDYAGPRPTGAAGALFTGCGYLVLWLGMTHRIANNYLLMGFGMSLIGLGAGGLYSVAVAPNIANFGGKYRGRVVGMLAALYGLSGAIFTQIYKLTFRPNVTEFLLFLAISLCVISLIATVFVNYVPKDILATQDETSSLLPEETEQPLYNVAEQQQSHGALLNINDHGEKLEELANPQSNTIQMLSQLNFWIYLPVYVLGSASGYMIISNVGSIMLSLGGHDGAQDNLVILLSLSNCAGRVIFGIMSDAFSKKLNRPGFATIAVALMGLTNLYLSFANVEMLYFGIIMVGISYGAICLMAPIITNELWGNVNWGSNYSVLGVFPVVFNYSVSVLIAGKLYEKNITDGTTMCHGQACYQTTFWITSSLCAFGTICGVILYFRTRNLYRLKKAFNKGDAAVAGH